MVEQDDGVGEGAFKLPNFKFSRIAFFASHGGSSMQGIVAACGCRLQATPQLVISNNPNSMALDFAKAHGIFCAVLNVKRVGSQKGVDQKISQLLEERGVDLIILSGYMKLLGAEIVERFAGRILNIHPGLLPKYGGQGMYGLNVHRAVIAAGEKESGITIHQVNQCYDQGPIIAQKRIPIFPGETAEELAERIKLQEPPFFVETLELIQRINC